MANYNKFKSTAFNGTVYSDTFDSLNNSVTISNPTGTTTVLGNINLNSVSNTNGCVQNDLSTGSDCVIGGQLSVNSDFHSVSNVYANNIYANNVYCKNQWIGFLYINTLTIPILNKSNYDITTTYTNLNLQTLFYNNSNTTYILLNPQYSISFYNCINSIVQTVDNTNNTNILYQQLTLSTNYIIKYIVKLNNFII